jgi:oligopeptide/dipeptide ABC transporter ATP-binding protein
MGKRLSIIDIHKHFPVSGGVIKAVDGVSFELKSGRTLALVGESGCGKSTVALALLRLAELETGEISFDGQNISAMSRSELQQYRRQVSIVFQNPYSSLNPKMRLKSIVGEPLIVCYGLKGKELIERVVKHLEQVGLGAELLNRFPHQFSGGQRQRIAIARALALEPGVLILDEPTAALDVSVQAQVLNLLKDLKQRLGLAYLFISHNLATVEYIADEVMVMYLGKIVEQGPVESIFQSPRHPYTRGLLDSVPSIDPSLRDQLRIVKGELPDPLDLPAGCAYISRCGQAIESCKALQPELKLQAPDNAVACFNPNNSEQYDE